jgi:integrase/recombinase XerD
MKLSDLVNTYITFKRSLGMRFHTQGRVLCRFCRTMGNIDIAEVQPEAVHVFLNGHGPITAGWQVKYFALDGFYRYAVSRDFVATSPLPPVRPELPPYGMPYIYSVDEIRRLLAATEVVRSSQSPLREQTYRTLLLLLYSTGVRIGEALSLALADVDLANCLLTIRHAKFFKSRWVPIGPRLTRELVAYAQQRRRLPLPDGEQSAFFASVLGSALTYRDVNAYFQKIRQKAGMQRDHGARFAPRIHDIRHTAAVHRVCAWYRAGADVQKLLPQLATYLGHKDIGSTQRYLTMTPELLQEASRRFEAYAQPETYHE